MSHQEIQTEQGHYVGIAMATYNPKSSFLEEQIKSLMSQTHSHWRCIIVDDNSSLDCYENIKRLVSQDSRFELHRNSNNIGSFKTFERALQLLPKEVDFICYCDQDDVWSENKLARQLEIFKDPEVSLVHSDQALIDKDGKIFVNSCWELDGRENLQPTTDLLLFRSLITGCTTMFRKTVLVTALPFSAMRCRQEMYHHDMWVAMHACVHGRVVSLHEQLVFYRQHGNNLVGVSSLRTGCRSKELASRAHTAFKERYGLREDFLKSLKEKGSDSSLEQADLLSYLDSPLGLMRVGMAFVIQRPRFFRTWIMLFVGLSVFNFRKLAFFKIGKVR